MPKVTEAHAEARRLQILSAACICFAKKGFHRSTIQDICQTAGLSTGAVYTYFASKNDLIEAMVGESFRQSQEILDRVRAMGTVREAFRELTRLFLEALEAGGKSPNQSYDPHRIKVGLWAESIRSADFLGDVQANFRMLMREFEAIVRRGQKNGEVPLHLDAAAIAQTYVSLLEGYTLQRAFDENVDRDNYVEAMTVLLEQGLFRPAQSRE